MGGSGSLEDLPTPSGAGVDAVVVVCVCTFSADAVLADNMLVF